MDARHAQGQQRLRQRDAEISRLQQELRVNVHTFSTDFDNKFSTYIPFMCVQDQTNVTDASVTALQSPQPQVS